MAVEKIDYTTILADMRAKRSALDSSIAALETAIASGALGQAVEGSTLDSGPTIGQPMDLPSGAFLGKSLPDAIKLYLTAMRQRKGVREITVALKQGGMVSTSDNFESVVSAALQRLKGMGMLLKFPDGWGLAEWYPAGFRSTAEKAKAKKGKRRKATAPKAPRKTPNTEQGPIAAEDVPRPQAETHKRGAQVAIESYFDANPGFEFSTGELAKALQVKTGAANLVCAKLAHRGKLEKTTSGKYRSTKLHAMPKAV